MSGDSFNAEVARARLAYDEYEAQGRHRTAWAAFSEVEAAYRSQQALSMATLMRGAGFADLSGLKVLDVGCGRGRLVRAFLDLGAQPEDVAGLDVHEPSLAYARALAPHLTFSTFSGSDIPYPDASFDLVTQCVVFSSIGLAELRRRLAVEMLRVVRPGGLIFWWDAFQLGELAAGAADSLDLSQLFGELPRTELHVGWKPTLGQIVRIPSRWRRFVRPVLDGLPLLSYPATHVASLIGPKP